MNTDLVKLGVLDHALITWQPELILIEAPCCYGYADVLVIRKDHTMIEIEIKKSLSDLCVAEPKKKKYNFKYWDVRWKVSDIQDAIPNRVYFCLTEDIYEEGSRFIRSNWGWAGIMTIDGMTARNPKIPRISIKKTAKTIHPHALGDKLIPQYYQSMTRSYVSMFRHKVLDR